MELFFMNYLAIGVALAIPVALVTESLRRGLAFLMFWPFVILVYACKGIMEIAEDN